MCEGGQHEQLACVRHSRESGFQIFDVISRSDLVASLLLFDRWCFSRLPLQEDGGGVVLSLDLGNGKVFSLSGVPGRGPFSVSTIHPFLLDGLFVENLEEIQAQARRIQVGVYAVVSGLENCRFSFA